MIRFLNSQEKQSVFLQLEPQYRLAMLNGFKLAVLECLRHESPEKINHVLRQIDYDYDEILASGIDASKPRV